MNFNKLLIIGVAIGFIGALISAFVSLISNFHEMRPYEIALLFTVGILIKTVTYIAYAAIASPFIKYFFKRRGWWED